MESKLVGYCFNIVPTGFYTFLYHFYDQGEYRKLSDILDKLH